MKNKLADVGWREHHWKSIASHPVIFAIHFHATGLHPPVMNAWGAKVNALRFSTNPIQFNGKCSQVPDRRPPMSSTPPQYSYSPQADPTGTPKKPWLRWVAIGCGGLIVVVAVLAVLMFVVVKKATAGPEEAVKSFLAAAGSGNYTAAYAYFSTPLQQVQSLEAFTTSAKANPALFQVVDTTFNERSVDLSGAQLSGVLNLKSGTKMPASFKLVKENDAWKLIAYQIGSK
ncbi:MAG: hypothetical protein ABSH28_12205 [Acidobacteriota bacterium]